MGSYWPEFDFQLMSRAGHAVDELLVGIAPGSAACERVGVLTCCRDGKLRGIGLTRSSAREFTSDLKKGVGPIILLLASALAGVAQAVGLDAWVGIGAAGIAVVSGAPLVRREFLVPRRMRIARQAVRPFLWRATHGEAGGWLRANAVQIAAGVWVTGPLPDVVPQAKVLLPGGEELMLRTVHQVPGERKLVVLHSDRTWPYCVTPQWVSPEGGEAAVIIGWPFRKNSQLPAFPLTVTGVFEEAEDPSLVATIGTAIQDAFQGAVMVSGQTGHAIAVVGMRSSRTHAGAQFEQPTVIGHLLGAVPRVFRKPAGDRPVQQGALTPGDPEGTNRASTA